MGEVLRVGARVTLALGDRPEPEAHPGGGEGEVIPGRTCSPSEPRESGGLYWGYTTRLASGLSAALSDSPFEVCLVAHRSVTSCDVTSFALSQAVTSQAVGTRQSFLSRSGRTNSPASQISRSWCAVS